MTDIILFGAPGCGKGTQAKRLKGYRHISTGDMMRAAVAANTDIGKRIDGLLGTGLLIPDEITLELVESVCTDAQPIAWDGFPRTVPQARALDVMNEKMGRSISHIFNLVVPPDVLLERVLGRYEVSKRPDDNPDSFKVRLATYLEKTKPVLDYYAGRVITIEGTQKPEEIASYIANML
jgi:adenylate kinase